MNQSNNLDLSKVVKLLNLTQSSVDAEALLAVRKANELIKKHSLGWDKIISEVSPKAAPRSSGYSHRENDFGLSADGIQDAIDELETFEGFLNPWQQDFLISIRRFFEINLFLTNRQIEILLKTLKETRNKKRFYTENKNKNK